MLTAHLPSGYVLARLAPEKHRLLMPAALIGAVLPAFWAALAALALPGLAVFARSLLAPALIFFAALFLHMVLDTIGGGILWGAPFDNRLHTLVEVPAAQAHWVLSFLLHWTFLLELGVWALALYLWRKGRRI